MKKLFCIIISLLILIVSIVSGQNIKKISKAGNVNRFTQVQAPQIYLYRNQLNKVVTTNFLITYETNVPSEARTAFDKAVEIWSYLIVLSKPIKIKVRFVNDPNSGMLGGTGIPSWRNNFTNVPVYDRQYPISLAKHLDNSINYTEYDIEMEFNGAKTFNYSLDGVPIADHFDFITVALHEIGHGLGLFASFNVQQNEGYFGFNGYPVLTTNTYPTIADQFYLSGTSRLINVTSSSTLGGLLQNNNIWYDGTNAKNANNNQNIKMYAPSVWEPGSSIDHLDESSFPAGNLNSLMTPTLDPAEVNHNPGPIFLGMLKDYGHTVGRIITFTAPLSNNNIVKGQNFNITWHDNISGFGDYINFDLYKITTGEPLLIESINGNNYVFSNPGTQGNSYSWSVPTTLENNFYFIRAVGTNHLVDYGQSQVFTISNIPEAPKFNPPGGQYSNQQWVSIYTNSPVTEIRYTLNGTEPNETSTPFTSPILVDASKTIRAKSILVLPNGTKVLSPSSDATYFIGSNSFVKEFTSSYYGYYARNGSWNDNSTQNGLKIGKGQSNNIYRSFIEWNNIRTQIPPGSIIQSVEVILHLEPSYTPASIEFREFNRSPYWTHNWDSLGLGALISTMSANLQEFSVEGLISKVQNIVSGAGSDLVRIGIKNANENEYSHLVYFPWNNPILRIYYRGNVEITQLDKDDQPFGQVGYWNGSAWENKNVPATVFKSGTITLKSYQGYKKNTTQKYYKWLNQIDIVNHISIDISSGVNFFTSIFNESNLSVKAKNHFTEMSNFNPINDKIWFKDPWLIDEMDAQYGLRNQGIGGGTTGSPGADWYQLDSPIDFSDPAFSNYKGVFLNQDYSVPGNPYYSVKTDLTQDIILHTTGVPSGRNHKFYFQNWSGTNANFQNANNIETPVVFTAENAVAQANFKGTGLTNNSSTYSNNNQRRFVKTADGTLHNVYESMGKIWYEISADKGSTWQIMNNSKPISASANAKSPAIANRAGSSEILVVYQDMENEKIVMQFYDNYSYQIPLYTYEINHWAFGESDATPSVGWRSNGQLMLAYDIPNVWGSDPGIWCWYGFVNGHGFLYETTEKVPNTGSTSDYPSIVSEDYTNETFHLVWEDDNSSINYIKVTGQQANNDMVFSNYYEVSAALGYTENIKPVVSDYVYDRFLVSWLAYSPMLGHWIATARINYGTYWGSTTYTYSFNGEDVTSISNNMSSQGGCMIAYGNSAVNGKYVKTKNLNGPISLPNKGAVKVSNGSDYTTMRVSSLVTSTSPYYFSTYAEEDELLKTKMNENFISREINIPDNGKKIFVNLGEIEVNGEKIGFYNIDSLGKKGMFNNKEKSNLLISESFEINKETEIYFSSGMLSQESVSSDVKSNRDIKAKIVLINDENNQIVGTIKTFRMNDKSNPADKLNRYRLNNEFGRTMKAKLGLIVEGVEESEINVTNLISSAEENLPKENIKEIALEESDIPTEYKLYQNYPNPFNPSTTIQYSISSNANREKSNVKIIVYDMLGREVATLVDENKPAGNYEVKFDGSNLASGIYFYKLQSGSFTQTKKLLLLK